MGIRLLSSILTATALIATLQLTGQEPAPAAKGKGKGKRITGPVPRLPDGKPNLSGVWGTDRPSCWTSAARYPKARLSHSTTGPRTS